MEPLRAAIIGCGRMGSTIDDELPRWASSTKPYSHAARYAAVEDTVVVAACDPDAVKLAAFGERWGVTALYSDVDEMMKQERPDLVSICTHTGIRHEVTLKVIAHGPRGIFMEKPMAETLRQCDEIIDACEQRGIVTAVNCSRRWEPGFTQAKALIAEAIGPLRCITAFCNGGLSHMGSHLLDLVRYLADDAPAEWVTGHVPGADAGEQDVAGLGLIQFAGPVHAYVNMLDAGAVGVDVDLIGTTGRIQIGDNGNWCRLWAQTKEALGRSSLAELPFPQPYEVPHFGRMSVLDLAQCVRQGGKPRCAAVDGRAALELALALRHSERLGGQRVALPYPDLDDAIRSV
ncbi:MAG: Gfo/Idh/MocA family oxidoreductase [Armatimonadota bacterium]